MDLGIDVGGTFTDLVSVDRQSQTVRVVKVPSTPSDPSIGFLTALDRLGTGLERAERLVHGTTVATNAIIQRKGAACGLITTRGFRDVLELRRRDRPTLYGLTGFFEPLIPREMRLEVDERTNHAGQVLVPVAEEQVRSAARSLVDRGAQVLVVSFLHSYANPSNEGRVREIIRGLWPGGPVVLSSEVLPEIREFERTSTAVVNGYVLPVLDGYLAALGERLRDRNYGRGVLLVQSNGGVMAAELARSLPVNTVLSGPAAGVIAGAELARAAGFRHAITCDMGGTSFDVSLVWDGSPRFAEEKHVEFGVPVRIPHIDITTIGAGGGSIAWIDRGGILRVGPQSAGAEPGPACYGKGGTDPTVTDAHLVLGHIDPGYPIAGKEGVRLDLELAQRAVLEKVARPLGLGLSEAASAILAVADSNMAGSLRSVSVERGFDPRDFVLVAFGGAGPLHVSALMREADIGQGLVPYYPGATSALGCVLADFRHDFVQTLNLSVAALDSREVREVLRRQRQRGMSLLRGEGFEDGPVTVLHEADMAYEGQIHTVRVALTSAEITREELRQRFEERYREEYGYLLEGYPLVLLNLRTTVVGSRSRPAWERFGVTGPARAEAALKGSREVYLAGAFRTCPVYQRAWLSSGAVLAGPAIVEQEDTTVLIEPGLEARVDMLGNLLIRRQ
jgi:N-methylhydantoinase A